MRRLLPVMYCTVFALEADGKVSAVSTASNHGSEAETTAVEYVRQGFDRQDSNMVWLARKRAPVRSQVWISHQSEEEVANPEYRRICYGEPGISERTSVLLLLNDGRRIAISFYRGLAYPVFTEADFVQIAACAPILHAAVIAHLRTVSQDFAGKELYGKVLSQLASREREVIAHVLAGRTTVDTAQRLGLSPRTVLTYRYRAFAKLGVRTQRELLAILNRLPANLTRTS
jgi:DNA-binding CsgD family transcriptional regulator